MYSHVYDLKSCHFVFLLIIACTPSPPMAWAFHRMDEQGFQKLCYMVNSTLVATSQGTETQRFKDVAKWDLKSHHTNSWETLQKITIWHETLTWLLESGEMLLLETAMKKRAKRKPQADSNSQSPSQHVCNNCRKDCQSHISLCSHRKCCIIQPAEPNDTLCNQQWLMVTNAIIIVLLTFLLMIVPLSFSVDNVFQGVSGDLVAQKEELFMKFREIMMDESKVSMPFLYSHPSPTHNI